MPPLVQIVVGSTRPGRVGPVVADWVATTLRGQDSVEFEIVDLADVALPLFDEPCLPMAGQYVHEHTKAWSATVERADAFIFVTPEYNHGPNAATKNAIDFLKREWDGKAVSFVSYGGISGGMRAAQQLKQIVLAVGMTPTHRHVLLPFVHSQVGDGGFHAGERETHELALAIAEIISRATEFAARHRAPHTRPG